jgi:hypothetical protein
MNSQRAKGRANSKTSLLPLIRPNQPGYFSKLKNPVYGNQAVAVTGGISLIYLVRFKGKQAIAVTRGIRFINLIPRKGV